MEEALPQPKSRRDMEEALQKLLLELLLKPLQKLLLKLILSRKLLLKSNWDQEEALPLHDQNRNPGQAPQPPTNLDHSSTQALPK